MSNHVLGERAEDFRTKAKEKLEQMMENKKRVKLDSYTHNNVEEEDDEIYGTEGNDSIRP